MPKLLIIDNKYREDIKEVADALEQKHQDYCVSFLIVPKENTLLLIGGHEPNYIQKRIPLPDNHQLTKIQFTVDGAFFRQLPIYSTEVKAVLKNSKEVNVKLEKDIVLELHKDGGCYPLVGLTSENEQWRSYKSTSLYPAHDAFIKEIQQHAYESARVSEILAVLNEVDTHSPFQYIDIDKELREMRVQSDNNQTFHSIPDNIPVPLSMALTQEVAHTFKKICERTKDGSVQVSTHGEKITFKTTETTTTRSLAGIEDFYKNKPKQYSEEVSMVVNIYRFKDEITEFYSKYPKIRRANQSYLLVEPNQLYIANTVGDYRFGAVVEAKGISITEKQLYLIHLKDIEAIKIKDLTATEELKIAILKGPQGEYKLGFYKNGNFKYPHDSVSIEPAAEAMDEVKAIQKKQQESKDGKTEKPDNETMDDLFGFEDI